MSAAAAGLGVAAPVGITERTAALVFLAASKRTGPVSPASLAEEDALHTEAATVSKPAAALLASGAANTEAISALAAAASAVVMAALTSVVVGAALAADIVPLLQHAAIGPALSAAAPALAEAVNAVTATAWWKEASAAANKAPAGKKGKTESAATKDAPAAAAGGKAAGGKKEKGGAAPAAGGASLLVLADLPCPVPEAVTAQAASGPEGDAFLAIPLIDTLEAVFTAAIAAAFPAAAELGIRADVQINSNATFPHQYQCNSALALGGRLKGKPGAPANPRAAAEALQAALKTGPPCALIGKTEIAGPGYINVYLSGQYVAARVAHVLSRGVVPPPLGPAGARSVVVDYSSPNIAKEMHIGHLRSTIIGDAIARVLEFAGHAVARVNHVGDWGTQFGMLIAHLKDTLGVKQDSDAAAVSMSLTDLTGLYKAAKKR